MKNHVQSAIEREVKRQLKAGGRCLPLSGLKAEAAALGYTPLAGLHADCWARIMTGEGAGDSYPCRSLYAIEADTKRSAFHFESRRDDNFKAFQALRGNAFAISRGRIVTF